jgi:hypothetical protein
MGRASQPEERLGLILTHATIARFQEQERGRVHVHVGIALELEVLKAEAAGADGAASGRSR